MGTAEVTQRTLQGSSNVGFTLSAMRNYGGYGEQSGEKLVLCTEHIIYSWGKGEIRKATWEELPKDQQEIADQQEWQELWRLEVVLMADHRGFISGLAILMTERKWDSKDSGTNNLCD